MQCVCVLCYDTVHYVRPVVVVRCTVVGIVGGVGMETGEGKRRDGGRPWLRGCRREAITRRRGGCRATVRVTGNKGEEERGRKEERASEREREVVLLVFVAHAYCRRQSGELLAKFNWPEVR